MACGHSQPKGKDNGYGPTRCHKMSYCLCHFRVEDAHTLLLLCFIWMDSTESKMQNGSLANVCVRAKIPMRRELEKHTERERWRGKGKMVLWSGDNTKLVWVVCQACKRNITLTPTLARRIPCGISMSAKLWQSLSNQGPVALNYWAVTSNNNSCISKAHEIIGDIKLPLVCWRCGKWKMADRRPLLIWGLAHFQAEVAIENCFNLKRTDVAW